MEQTTAPLTEDETARHLEAKLNKGWHDYVIQSDHRHHDIFAGMKCRVRFGHFRNGNPCIEVVIRVRLFPHTNMPTPFTHHIKPLRRRWLFPGIEDEQEARRLYESKKGRMLPY